MGQSYSWLVVLLCFCSSVWAGEVNLTWNYAFAEVPSAFEVYRFPSGQTEYPSPSKALVARTPYTGIEEYEVVVREVPDGNFDWYVIAVPEAGSGLEASLPSNVVGHLMLAQHYWVETKYEYDALGRVLYKGEHYIEGALDSDIEWWITKYEYDGSGKILKVRMQQTSWEDRANGW